MLILVRHGEVAANAHGLLLGRADPPLTDTGRRQAAALATLLPNPARIVSSPLRRARDTAEVIAAGRAVDVDERWVEMDYGALDGCPPTAVDEPTWDRWRTDPRFVPAGGESVSAVADRVAAACRELTSEAARTDVIVISHVSPIKAAVAWALGVDDEVVWRMFLGTAAICRIDTRPARPQLLCFSDTAAAQLRLA